jgi:hypothetical protein
VRKVGFVAPVLFAFVNATVTPPAAENVRLQEWERETGLGFGAPHPASVRF